MTTKTDAARECAENPERSEITPDLLRYLESARRIHWHLPWCNTRKVDMNEYPGKIKMQSCNCGLDEGAEYKPENNDGNN